MRSRCCRRSFLDSGSRFHPSIAPRSPTEETRVATISCRAQIGIGASGADPNLVSRDFDATQFRKIPNADQLSRRQVSRQHIAPLRLCLRRWEASAPGSFASSDNHGAQVAGRDQFDSQTDSTSCGRPAARRFGHGFDNLAVASAAAEIAGKSFADFLHCGFGFFAQ